MPWARGKGSLSTAARSALSSRLIPGNELPIRGFPAAEHPSIAPQSPRETAIRHARPAFIS